MCQSHAADKQMFLKCQILQVTFTFQEHLRLKSVVTHPCSSGRRIFPKMLNTCSTGAEETASAKYFLARLESAWKWASAVFWNWSV